MRFAVLEGGSTVTNVLRVSGAAPLDVDGVLLESPAHDQVGIGWSFDGVSFSPPAAVGEARSFTPLELIGPGGLLTDAEKAAIFAAAAQSIAVNVWLLTLASAERIVVDDPRTIQGFQFAIDQGLLSAERVSELLA